MCGVQAVYLVCAVWSLGAPVGVGDLIIPSFSLGLDGTSIHYGNTQGEVRTDPVMVEALANACRALQVRHYVGGNASFEALYRITPQSADDFRGRGCLCMENGEVSTLIAATHSLSVLGGALVQPYIDLERGWNPDLLRDERYRAGCRAQAEVVLEASLRLREAGRLPRPA